MKKLLLFTTLFVGFALSAQTIVTSSEQLVKGSNWDAYLGLHDEHYGDANFNEGSGLVIQRIRISESDYNMRVIRYGNMNDWGLSTPMDEYQRPAFWRGVSDQIEKWGPNNASKGIYNQGGGSGKYKFAQIYDAKISNPQAFLSAFKTWLKENDKIIKERWISVSSYTIAGPGGATHSVTISAESWFELEQLRELWGGNTNSAQKFYENRGEVIDTRNFLVQRLRHYNNATIKAGSTKD